MTTPPPSSVTEPSSPAHPPMPVPAVIIRDLHFHYPTSDGSLHGISLTVHDGESVALIGPNGAGKSTLLLHFNGLLPESPRDGAGTVQIYDTPITRQTLHKVRRDVGLLFQDPDDQLFCHTVFEDVAFGPRQFTPPPVDLSRLVAESLARVGLAGYENRSPHRLSGGEKRRVCIAGLLACSPRVLVLDEPTTNLDPRARRQLIGLLRDLPVTKVIATHDLEMVLEICPRSILIDDGTIVADGPSRLLLADEQLMLAHGLEVPASLAAGPRTA